MKLAFSVNSRACISYDMSSCSATFFDYATTTATTSKGEKNETESPVKHSVDSGIRIICICRPYCHQVQPRRCPADPQRPSSRLLQKTCRRAHQGAREGGSLPKQSALQG